MEERLDEIKSLLENIDLNKKSSADTLLDASAMLTRLANDIIYQLHQ
ncbi:hypothetical protein ACUIJP_04430 [Leuconostoc pseudomesenteroides]